LIIRDVRIHYPGRRGSRPAIPVTDWGRPLIMLMSVIDRASIDVGKAVRREAETQRIARPALNHIKHGQDDRGHDRARCGEDGSPMSHSEELDFALDCARTAAARIRAIADAGFDVQHKPDGSLVTTADREVNRWFIERVAERFPSDRVLGEELSREGGPRTWVIDPLDGTQHFVLGIPVWTVAIALIDEAGRPVLGVACNPSVREGSGSLYWAARGAGAFRDGSTINVSTRTVAESAWIRGAAAPRPTVDLSGTLLEVGFGQRLTATEHRLLPAVFACCLVAEGRLDGVLFTGSGAHDLAAGCVIVREAGGMVTDLSGADQRYDGPLNGGVVSNKLVHGELLRHAHL
jgi:fructose-1,6-bisphosphatase/inositol monophosphatase family enzyme